MEPNTQADSAKKRVLVTGASGFVGRNVCHTLVQAGYEVSGLFRQTPHSSDDTVGVSHFTGDVTKPNSLPPAAFACDAIVHLVGIIAEVKKTGQTLEAVHVGGTQNLLNAAKAAGFAGRFMYVSALGASLTSPSEYSRTKARAEQAVQNSGFAYTIFRPSIILGPGCEFLAQMEDLIKRPPLTPFALPFIPVPGNGENKFQPVWIGDLCEALISALQTPEASGRLFDVGGADTISFNALLGAIAAHLGIQKPLLHAPMGAMKAAATVFQSLLSRPPVTVDQLTNLQTDNTGDISALRDVLKISPLPFAEALGLCYQQKPR